MTKLLSIVATLALATTASAIGPDDAYQVGYAANFLPGDSFVNVDNAGTPGRAGNICANVYVFAADEQLIACCTCPLTPNNLKSLSVRRDLINNTLTPGVPTAITIALVGSTGPACNAATVTPANLVGGLRAWGITLHASPNGTFGVSETEFEQVPLGAGVLQKAASYCGFIQAIGSGYGICNSCRRAAQGAVNQ